MAVYTDGLKCFGCGKAEGRRMEALAYLLYGDAARWRDAIAVCAAYTFQSVDHARRRVGGTGPVCREPLPSILAELYHDYLYHGREHRLWYFAGRCLIHDTIAAFKLGHDGTRFTIPVFDSEGNLLTIRFRRDDYYGVEDEWGRTYSKYSGMQGRNGDFLYPEDKIANERPSTLYIFEGELDTILAWQCGLPAVTMTNGARNMSKIPAMIRAPFPFVKTLCVVGDMDEAGRTAAHATLEAAHVQGFATLRAEWPLWMGKDLTERRQNGHPLETLEGRVS